MKYFAGYMGCLGVFLLLMGLVFHAFVLPQIKSRKKSFLEWIMIAVFGLGMLESMAVKPGGGNTPHAPRHSPPQQTVESTNSVEIASTTNTPPWETTLAFSHIETTSSNVQLTVAWPTGFYNYDPILDLFIAYPTLTNDWQWITCQSAASSDSNCTFTVTPSTLGLAKLPPALFARVTERTEVCETMDDPDGDGIPNRFEFYHGTNPYEPDAHMIQTLDCTNTNLSTLKTVLANSTEYSIINLPTGTIDAAESIVMPQHPVLLSGPKNGYTVIKSAANLGAFMFKEGQDSHTLIRNVYLDLLKRGSFQVGFWSGGNLPWEGIGASPSFENIVIRMPRPETEYIGWLFYGDNGKTASLSNCLVNALGATWVRGIETGNGPSVDVKDFTCNNTPTNFTPTLSRTFALGNNGRTNQITSVGHEATVFIDLTPGLDSDGDGITNDREHNEFGTDPWLADSDGDGVNDLDELLSETDPLDVTSFQQTIFILVTNTTAVANSAVYVSWSSDDPLSALSPLTNSSARSFSIPFRRPEDTFPVVVTTYRDLNGNGRFDEDFDIRRSVTVTEDDSVVRTTFTFGDIDGDGIDDLQERFDGSDPYHPSSLRIARTVKIVNNDNSPQTTNYVAQGLTKEWNAADPFHRMAGISENMTIHTNAISGAVYVKCFRDFNRNGVYDEDIEPLYVYTIQNETPSSMGTVNVEFKDKDGDTIPDSIEWSEGTDINDKRSYCYSANLTVTGIFSTTNQLYSQAFFGTNAITEAHLLNTNQEAYTFEHFSTTNSERFVVKYWDDLNANLMLDDGEPFTTATAHPNGHETTLTYDLPYSKFDTNSNRLPDWWEIATGLSANSSPYDYFTDTDNDGLINLHEYLTGCDPLTPDGANTLLSALSKGIADLTANTNKSTRMFSNYPSSDPRASIQRNNQFFASSVDLSSVSVWNSAGLTQRCATVISPYHIVGAAHWQVPKNYSVYFLGNDGIVYSNKVIDARSYEYHYWNSPANTRDIAVGILDTPLPPSVCPVLFLPSNIVEYVGTGEDLPVLSISQDRIAFIREIGSTIAPVYPNVSISYHSPKLETRSQFGGIVRGGDSSCPNFLIINNQPILLGCHLFAGSAPSTLSTKPIIQSLMNELSDAKSRPRYSLRELDISTYSKIKNLK